MRMKKFFRKYHKWLGVSLALLLILFSLSGIVLNHRDLFSSVDVSRSVMPGVYRYTNWNNAAVRGSLRLSPDSLLLYGNVGVWLTDNHGRHFTGYNAGFPKGIDNRKIFKLLKSDQGLLAATLFGLYRYDPRHHRWLKLQLPVAEENVVDLLTRDSCVWIMTRSHLLSTTDLQHFRLIQLPEPEGYDHKVGLFKTLWVIHSGEIYGRVGKLLVDGVALIFIFLSVGGVVLLVSRRNVKRLKAFRERRERNKKRYQWNLKWHNKVGWFSAVLLIVTVLTGSFLRPPLLIAIGDARVSKIPNTELDTPNPWFDLLRRIIYIPDQNRYFISTSEGFYSFDADFRSKAQKLSSQPPVSVMGLNVLDTLGTRRLLIGSFEGLFSWDYSSGSVFDLMKNKPYVPPVRKGPPVGDYKITGYSADFGNHPVAFEYVQGAVGVNHKSPFCAMPDSVLKVAPMSLWNVALEVHTARVYGALIGNLYVLIIPLAGLLVLFIIVSGLVLYKRK